MPDSPAEDASRHRAAPDDLIARVGLAACTAPGDLRVWDAVRRAGAAATWAALVDARRRAGIATVDPRRLLDAAPPGTQLLVPGQPGWPVAVDVLARTAVAPPLVLWARGWRGPTGGLTVAVVGARAATAYGVHVATVLGHDLAAAGVTVVSGLAYGVDAAAHRGAVSVAAGAAGPPTCAVLAGDLHRIYPAGHRVLAGQIAAAGGLLTEAAPGTPPDRSRLLARNRLIAALADAVVLVEAAPRSGARNTVGHARSLGRLRCVVPGAVTSAVSLGPLAELRDDPEVRAVGSAADVLADLAPFHIPAPARGAGSAAASGDLAAGEPAAGEPGAGGPGAGEPGAGAVGAVDAGVLAAVRAALSWRDGRSPAEVSAATGLPHREVLRALRHLLRSGSARAGAGPASPGGGAVSDAARGPDGADGGAVLWRRHGRD